MAIRIFLSPSSQPGNLYAWGNTNEQVQCRKMADATEAALKRCGFEVKNSQGPTVEDRVAASNAWPADLHLAIHTNAFNGKVAGTRMFACAKGTPSWDCALAIFNTLAPVTPGTSENLKTYPGLYELRKAKNMAVYCEVDFHDVPDVARWLCEHSQDVGEAICKGCCNYFNVKYIAPEPEQLYHVQVGAFKDRENAENFLATVRNDYPDAFIIKY